MLAGVAVSLTEIVIGLLALSGFLTRLAAAGGLALSLILFLTASWKTSPYFLGSDIVFVFAWLPFALAGARGQPAVDHALDRRAPRAVRPVLADGEAAAVASGPGLTRRGLILRGLSATGAAALGVATLSTVLKGTYYRAPRKLTNASAGPPAGAHGPQAAPPRNATRLGPAKQLPAGQAAGYTDPSDGKPALLIRQGNGSLTALSAVCTHEGCTVGYQDGQVVCPCHGATFDARTGAVTGGPAQSPLAVRPVVERGGQIYALRG